MAKASGRGTLPWIISTFPAFEFACDKVAQTPLLQRDEEDKLPPPASDGDGAAGEAPPPPPKPASVSAESHAPGCAICLRDFDDGEEVRVMLCRHAYHKACIDQWLSLNRECPTCRRDVHAMFLERNAYAGVGLPDPLSFGPAIRVFDMPPPAEPPPPPDRLRRDGRRRVRAEAQLARRARRKTQARAGGFSLARILFRRHIDVQPDAAAAAAGREPDFVIGTAAARYGYGITPSTAHTMRLYATLPEEFQSMVDEEAAKALQEFGSEYFMVDCDGAASGSESVGSRSEGLLPLG